jgi:hypothetical protein
MIPFHQKKKHLLVLVHDAFLSASHKLWIVTIQLP